MILEISVCRLFACFWVISHVMIMRMTGMTGCGKRNGVKGDYGICNVFFWVRIFFFGRIECGGNLGYTSHPARIEARGQSHTKTETVDKL